MQRLRIRGKNEKKKWNLVFRAWSLLFGKRLPGKQILGIKISDENQIFLTGLNFQVSGNCHPVKCLDKLMSKSTFIE
jgi:hypothetical protein